MSLPRAVYHQRRAELIERLRALEACEACRTVAHACTRHTAPVVRALLVEAAALLSA